jgi:hypothetical protein
LNCRGPLRRDLKLAYCVLQNASKIASDVSPKMCKAGTVPTALHVYIPEHCKSGSIHSDHTKDDQVALRLIRQLGSGSSSCASNSEVGFNIFKYGAMMWLRWLTTKSQVVIHDFPNRPQISKSKPNRILFCGAEDLVTSRRPCERRSSGPVNFRG